MITRVATRAVAVLAVAALVMAAWAYRMRSPSPSPSPPSLPYGMAITVDIQDDLARRADVVYAHVLYANRPDDPDRSAYAAAYLMVEPGAPLDPVIDAATAAIWRSTLTPCAPSRYTHGSAASLAR